MRFLRRHKVLIIHGTEDKVTSHAASKDFVSKLPEKVDKTFTSYEVNLSHIMVLNFLINVFQGGYHELHNEPNGGRERLVNECAEWILQHAVKTDAPGPARL